MADGFEFGESAGLFAQARPAGGEAKGVIGGGEEIGGGRDGRAKSAAWARDASSIWFRSA